jgi:cell division protein ZapA
MDTPDAAKQVVRVTIFNQSYSLSTSGDPQETMSLAHDVDELMSSIARRAGNLDSARTAVLACMHLADRLRTAERQLGTLRHSVHDKSLDFATLLDKAFAGGEVD